MFRLVTENTVDEKIVERAEVKLRLDRYLIKDEQDIRPNGFTIYLARYYVSGRMLKLVSGKSPGPDIRIYYQYTIFDSGLIQPNLSNASFDNGNLMIALKML